MVFAVLRLGSLAAYRRLAWLQERIVERFGSRFDPGNEAPATGFGETPLVTLHQVLDEARLADLREAAERIVAVERSWIPGHKQGGTVAYAALHELAPECIAVYRAPALLALCARLAGAPVVRTPLHDQSSCSLLVYERPGDHIGWHRDLDFYAGRHFTMLLPLINGGREPSAPSSAQLEVRDAGGARAIPTPPGTLVVFEGAKVLHRVTPLGVGERRVVLSMTFTTDARCSSLQGALRRCKDVAFFGARALWS
ncbi:MAG: 2OG-Fe(II) oxygenase [Planctomycetes bacterium]|nr:2OG-Fe(II) oxygenase [Planctomycetota bacterium]